MRNFLITDADIAGLNRGAVERTARHAKRAGTALTVVGVVLALAWGWSFGRVQWQIGGDCSNRSTSGILLGGRCVNGLERLDLTATQIQGVWVPAVAIAIGLTARVVADAAVARTGGSITGHRVGDEIYAPFDLAEDDGGAPPTFPDGGGPVR